MYRLSALEQKMINESAETYNSFACKKSFSTVVDARTDQTVLVQRAISIRRSCQSSEGYNIVFERKHGVKYANRESSPLRYV